MSNETGDHLLDTASEDHGANSDDVKTTVFAKFAFYTGLSLVPSCGMGCLFANSYLLNPLLRFIAGSLWIYILLAVALSILSAIIALIRIPLSKSECKGSGLALIGMLLSAGSFLVMAFYCISKIKY